jgi:hypothetical protein
VRPERLELPTLGARLCLRVPEVPRQPADVDWDSHGYEFSFQAG